MGLDDVAGGDGVDDPRTGHPTLLSHCLPVRLSPMEANPSAKNSTDFRQIGARLFSVGEVVAEGNMGLLQWARDNGCRLKSDICESAAEARTS